MLALQETRVRTNSKETRNQYSWYFSGENGTQGYMAGVAFVMNHDYVQYVEDLEPMTHRLMSLTIKHTPAMTLIAAYMPQAGRPSEEKDETYRKLDQHFRKHAWHGPT